MPVVLDCDSSLFEVYNVMINTILHYLGFEKDNEASNLGRFQYFSLDIEMN